MPLIPPTINCCFRSFLICATLMLYVFSPYLAYATTEEMREEQAQLSDLYEKRWELFAASFKIDRSRELARQELDRAIAEYKTLLERISELSLRIEKRGGGRVDSYKQIKLLNVLPSGEHDFAGIPATEQVNFKTWQLQVLQYEQLIQTGPNPYSLTSSKRRMLREAMDLISKLKRLPEHASTLANNHPGLGVYQRLSALIRMQRADLMRKHRNAFEKLRFSEYEIEDPSDMTPDEVNQIALLKGEFDLLHLAHDMQLLQIQLDKLTRHRSIPPPTSLDRVLPEGMTIRVALFSRKQDSKLVDLLEPSLNEKWAGHQIELLERRQIDKVLEEQGLNATLGDPVDMIRLGQILKCDLFLIPRQEKGLLEVIVVDARTAATLGVAIQEGENLDTLAETAEQAIRSAIPLMRTRGKDRRYVTLHEFLPAVDLPEERAVAQTMAPLMRRALLRRGVIVLEREHLDKISKEPTLSGLAQSLRTGSLIISGSIRRDDRGAWVLGIKADGQDNDRDRAINKTYTLASKDALHKQVEALGQVYAKHITGLANQARSPLAPRQEALSLLLRSRLHLQRKEDVEAIRYADAAAAIDPSYKTLYEASMILSRSFEVPYRDFQHVSQETVSEWIARTSRAAAYLDSAYLAKLNHADPGLKLAMVRPPAFNINLWQRTQSDAGLRAAYQEAQKAIHRVEGYRADEAATQDLYIPAYLRLLINVRSLRYQSYFYPEREIEKFVRAVTIYGRHRDSARDLVGDLTFITSEFRTLPEKLKDRDKGETMAELMAPLDAVLRKQKHRSLHAFADLLNAADPKNPEREKYAASLVQELLKPDSKDEDSDWGGYYGWRNRMGIDLQRLEILSDKEYAAFMQQIAFVIANDLEILRREDPRGNIFGASYVLNEKLAELYQILGQQKNKLDMRRPKAEDVRAFRVIDSTRRYIGRRMELAGLEPNPNADKGWDQYVFVPMDASLDKELAKVQAGDPDRVIHLKSFNGKENKLLMLCSEKGKLSRDERKSQKIKYTLALTNMDGSGCKPMPSFKADGLDPWLDRAYALRSGEQGDQILLISSEGLHVCDHVGSKLYGREHGLSGTRPYRVIMAKDKAVIVGTGVLSVFDFQTKTFTPISSDSSKENRNVLDGVLFRISEFKYSPKNGLVWFHADVRNESQKDLAGWYTLDMRTNEIEKRAKSSGDNLALVEGRIYLFRPYNQTTKTKYYDFEAREMADGPVMRTGDLPRSLYDETRGFKMNGMYVSLGGINGTLKLRFPNGTWQSKGGHGLTHRFVAKSKEGYPLIHCDHSHYRGLGIWWIVPKDKVQEFKP